MSGGSAGNPEALSGGLSLRQARFILGFPPEEEPRICEGNVQKAYKRLALLFHPDKNVDKDEQTVRAKFQQIVAARDLLVDYCRSTKSVLQRVVYEATTGRDAKKAAEREGRTPPQSARPSSASSTYGTSQHTTSFYNVFSSVHRHQGGGGPSTRPSQHPDSAWQRAARKEGPFFPEGTKFGNAGGSRATSAGGNSSSTTTAGSKASAAPYHQGTQSRAAEQSKTKNFFAAAHSSAGPHQTAGAGERDAFIPTTSNIKSTSSTAAQNKEHSGSVRQQFVTKHHVEWECSACRVSEMAGLRYNPSNPSNANANARSSSSCVHITHAHKCFCGCPFSAHRLTVKGVEPGDGGDLVYAAGAADKRKTYACLNCRCENFQYIPKEWICSCGHPPEQHSPTPPYGCKICGPRSCPQFHCFQLCGSCGHNFASHQTVIHCKEVPVEERFFEKKTAPSSAAVGQPHGGAGAAGVFTGTSGSASSSGATWSQTENKTHMRPQSARPIRERMGGELFESFLKETLGDWREDPNKAAGRDPLTGGKPAVPKATPRGVAAGPSTLTTPRGGDHRAKASSTPRPGEFPGYNRWSQPVPPPRPMSARPQSATTGRASRPQSARPGSARPPSKSGIVGGLGTTAKSREKAPGQGVFEDVFPAPQPVQPQQQRPLDPGSEPSSSPDKRSSFTPGCSPPLIPMLSSEDEGRPRSASNSPKKVTKVVGTGVGVVISPVLEASSDVEEEADHAEPTFNSLFGGTTGGGTEQAVEGQASAQTSARTTPQNSRATSSRVRPRPQSAHAGEHKPAGRGGSASSATPWLRAAAALKMDMQREIARRPLLSQARKTSGSDANSISNSPRKHNADFSTTSRAASLSRANSDAAVLSPRKTSTPGLAQGVAAAPGTTTCFPTASPRASGSSPTNKGTIYKGPPPRSPSVASLSNASSRTTSPRKGGGAGDSASGIIFGGTTTPLSTSRGRPMSAPGGGRPASAGRRVVPNMITRADINGKMNSAEPAGQPKNEQQPSTGTIAGAGPATSPSQGFLQDGDHDPSPSSQGVRRTGDTFARSNILSGGSRRTRIAHKTSADHDVVSSSDHPWGRNPKLASFTTSASLPKQQEKSSAPVMGDDDDDLAGVYVDDGESDGDVDYIFTAEETSKPPASSSSSSRAGGEAEASSCFAGHFYKDTSAGRGARGTSNADLLPESSDSEYEVVSSSPLHRARKEAEATMAAAGKEATEQSGLGFGRSGSSSSIHSSSATGPIPIPGPVTAHLQQSHAMGKAASSEQSHGSRASGSSGSGAHSSGRVFRLNRDAATSSKDSSASSKDSSNRGGTPLFGRSVLMSQDESKHDEDPANISFLDDFRYSKEEASLIANLEEDWTGDVAAEKNSSRDLDASENPAASSGGSASASSKSRSSRATRNKDPDSSAGGKGAAAHQARTNLLHDTRDFGAPPAKAVKNAPERAGSQTTATPASNLSAASSSSSSSATSSTASLHRIPREQREPPFGASSSPRWGTITGDEAEDASQVEDVFFVSNNLKIKGPTSSASQRGATSKSRRSEAAAPPARPNSTTARPRSSRGNRSSSTARAPSSSSSSSAAGTSTSSGAVQGRTQASSRAGGGQQQQQPRASPRPRSARSGSRRAGTSGASSSTARRAVPFRNTKAAAAAAKMNGEGPLSSQGDLQNPAEVKIPLTKEVFAATNTGHVFSSSWANSLREGGDVARLNATTPPHVSTSPGGKKPSSNMLSPRKTGASRPSSPVKTMSHAALAELVQQGGGGSSSSSSVKPKSVPAEAPAVEKIHRPASSAARRVLEVDDASVAAVAETNTKLEENRKPVVVPGEEGSFQEIDTKSEQPSPALSEKGDNSLERSASRERLKQKTVWVFPEGVDSVSVHSDEMVEVEEEVEDAPQAAASSTEAVDAPNEAPGVAAPPEQNPTASTATVASSSHQSQTGNSTTSKRLRPNYILPESPLRPPATLSHQRPYSATGAASASSSTAPWWTRMHSNITQAQTNAQKQNRDKIDIMRRWKEEKKVLLLQNTSNIVLLGQVGPPAKDGDQGPHAAATTSASASRSSTFTASALDAEFAARRGDTMMRAANSDSKETLGPEGAYAERLQTRPRDRPKSAREDFRSRHKMRLTHRGLRAQLMGEFQRRERYNGNGGNGGAGKAGASIPTANENDLLVPGSSPSASSSKNVLMQEQARDQNARVQPQQKDFVRENRAISAILKNARRRMRGEIHSAEDEGERSASASVSDPEPAIPPQTINMAMTGEQLHADFDAIFGTSPDIVLSARSGRYQEGEHQHYSPEKMVREKNGTKVNDDHGHDCDSGIDYIKSPSSCGIQLGEASLSIGSDWLSVSQAGLDENTTARPRKIKSQTRGQTIHEDLHEWSVSIGDLLAEGADDEVEVDEEMLIAVAEPEAERAWAANILSGLAGRPCG